MISVVVDDLASVRVDAVVRPASTTLEPLPPSNERFEQLAGPSFAGLAIREELAVGSAVVTDAGDLAAGLVIHAVIGTGTEAVTTDSVRRAFASTLHRALAWQIATLGVPPLGAGSQHIALEKSARVLLSVIRAHDFSGGFPSSVLVVVATEDDRRLFERMSRGQGL